MIFEKYYETINLLLINYKAKLFLIPFDNCHDFGHLELVNANPKRCRPILPLGI